MAHDLASVGERLRALRKARGLTLGQLAVQASVSASTLSRLESGKRQASLELLLPITRLLGIKIDDLVNPEAPDPRVRSRAIRRDGMIITRLAPDGSPIRTYKIVYPPRTSPPELRAHDGFEWLYVLSGKLRLRLGEQDLVLSRGEAAEFDTRIPHSISATGSGPAEIISIFNDDGERIHTHLPLESPGS